MQVLRSVAQEIAAASREGVEVAVVVGGGNFFRGINAWDGLERATADYMGMLATCMNAICLQVRCGSSVWPQSTPAVLLRPIHIIDTFHVTILF